jgi:hypothetical protein
LPLGAGLLGMRTRIPMVTNRTPPLPFIQRKTLPPASPSVEAVTLLRAIHAVGQRVLLLQRWRRRLRRGSAAGAATGPIPDRRRAGRDADADAGGALGADSRRAPPGPSRPIPPPRRPAPFSPPSPRRQRTRRRSSPCAAAVSTPGPPPAPIPAARRPASRAVQSAAAAAWIAVAAAPHC